MSDSTISLHLKFNWQSIPKSQNSYNAPTDSTTISISCKGQCLAPYTNCAASGGA